MPTTPNMLGIDITSTSVKLLELGRNGDRYVVKSYAVEPLPEGAVVDKTVKDSELLSESIKKALSQTRSKTRYAAVAVPNSLIISKILQMDAQLSDEDIENQIAFEAEKYIPYPLDEVSLDFDIIGPSEERPQLMDVLLIASRRENVENLSESIAEAGIKVEVVDVESYAVERVCRVLADSLPNKGIDETIAVIDIGATMTNLCVMYDLSVVFTREEVFGGSLLTKAIQRHYGLSYAEAGLAKKEGGLPDDYATEVLAPFKDSAVLQVRRALQFFFSASQHNKVNHIVLAGGASNIPGLAPLIEEQIGITTSVANPFADMIISSNVDAMALTNDAAAMLVSCGLALRSFEQ